MGDIKTQIRDIIDDIDFKHDAWKQYEIDPYATAYRAAERRVEEVLKQQQELDQKRQQMLLDFSLLALTLASGGTLAAVFGGTALKTVAKDAVVAAICNRNLERAFAVAHWIENNHAATFVVGKLWDEAENLLEAGVKESMKQTLQLGVAFRPSLNNLKANPGDPQLWLGMFVREAKIKLGTIARMVRDGSQSDEQKLAAMIKIKEAPYWGSAPKESVDKDGRLSDRIELSFYMHMVLDTDYIKFTRITTPRIAGSWPAEVTRFQVPITARARSTAYPVSEGVGGRPNAAWPAPTLTTDKHREHLTNPDRVGYSEIGSVVADAIDAVYRKCGFGEPFFSDQSRGLWRAAIPDRTTLIRAELTLAQLATRGMNPIAALR